MNRDVWAACAWGVFAAAAGVLVVKVMVVGSDAFPWRPLILIGLIGVLLSGAQLLVVRRQRA